MKFTYDTNNYFYVGCEPACFTKAPSTAGFVEFWKAEPTDADMSYRVELHQFLQLSLKFSDEAKVYIVDKDDERYCHIFIKGCSGEDYTGFFQTAGYIEDNSTSVCDSEQYSIFNIYTDLVGIFPFL